MNNIQELRAQIAVLQDATMDENRNFKSSYDEGRFDALTVVDYLLDSLQKEQQDIPSGQWLSEACSWLNQHALFYLNDTTDSYDDKKLIRDFRKYMRSSKNLITELRNPESTTSPDSEIPESRNPEIPESPNHRNPANYGLWTTDYGLWTIDYGLPRGTIYLSGPISGYDIQERRQFFDHIQQALEADGWKVMNPMRNGLPADATTQQHMRRDYQMLSQCDTIMMLPRWNHSAGCINEFNMAVSMGCQVCFCTKEGQPDKNTKPLLFD